MTLVEFLLARIAEDEAEAKSAEGLRLPEALPVGSWGPIRVLVECEAKRWAIHHIQPTFFPLHPANHGCGKCNALRAIALPYVDHPDFIPDWHL